ncbi:MAG: NUDIX hydrolase [Candidatus Omnitrophica bacterium]|nr:NUDIX hydrolase [Candidatus Omnitrophota bacterium]
MKKQRKPFRVLKSKHVFKGHICDVRVERLLLDNGKKIDREVVRQANAVVVVPRLPDGRLILIRQFRHATDGLLWEFPAGRVDKGERPAAAAVRELEEETGYRARRMKRLSSFYTSPGISTEWMHLFAASGLKKTKTCFEEDEFIEIKLFTPRRMEKMIRRGEICDAKTILSYLYWASLR